MTKPAQDETEFADKKSLIKAYALHLLEEAAEVYGRGDSNHCDFAAAEITARHLTSYAPGTGWQIKGFGFTKARS